MLLGDVELRVDEFHLEVQLPLVGGGQDEMGQHQAANDEQRRSRSR